MRISICVFLIGQKVGMQGKSNDFMSVHFQATPNFKLYFNIRYFGAHILSDLGIAMETKIILN